MEYLERQVDPLKILQEKHDLLLEKASEISNKIRGLEEELDENSMKKFPEGDEETEKIIKEGADKIKRKLAALKEELEKKWKIIHQIQGQLLEMEKNN
jgi:hypothetical protein